ncbi:MAG: serine--tRNA ligase [Bacteroidetes bacterium]|nr:MAG: serine--tRNA ligase [Bacteroidota bacterium]
MLEIQRIRTQAEEVVVALTRKRAGHAREAVAQILELDEKRRKILTELEKLRSEMNLAAKSIGQLMQSGKKEEAELAKSASTQAKEQIKSLEEELAAVEPAIQDQLVSLPNVPHTSVPDGREASDNLTVYQNDIQVTFDFPAIPHWELARKHDIIDWELGVKITGAGFPVYKGKGAQLQRALIGFFLDRAGEAGYSEVQPPLVVNAASGFGTGQLPDKEGQMYFINEDNFYLIPTAEVPITNIYRDEILAEDALPVKNCGYTPCFRREAGSYGKDVKGLNRLHQFDKVELVQIVHPEQSYEVLEQMVAHVESLLTALELPFRRLLLCTGDMSFASAKTYDLEVWSAAQGRWLEVSSVSNFETFQSNRLKLRYRDKEKKTQLAHTLNGSALALPRIVASLLENHQQADGSVRIPAALVPYTRFERIG